MPRESLLKLTQATTIGLGLLLALTTAFSTGCITPQPTPETTPNPTATIAPAEFLYPQSNLPTHTPTATTPTYDIPHGRLLAYGDHVGEFGGIHYEGGNPRGTMHIYMTEGNFDPALIPEARERFDRFYRHVPDQKIVVHKAQYPWSRLEEWKDTISKAKAGNNTLGIYSWGVSQGDRIITLDAAPMRGNRERIEAIIATTDVPRDAIQVSIGCDRARAELTAEKVSPNFKDTFAYSVEAQPRAIWRDRGPEAHHPQPDIGASPYLRGLQQPPFRYLQRKRRKRLALTMRQSIHISPSLTVGITRQTAGIHRRLGADRHGRLSSPTGRLPHQRSPGHGLS